MRPFDMVVVPLVWLITLWRARGLRTASRHSRALWAMWALWAVSFTIGVPAVRKVIDDLVGIASFANLPVAILSLCAATALFEFLREVTGSAPGRLARARWALLAGSAIGLTITFLALKRPDDNADLLTADANSPLAGMYWAIFLAYVSGAVVGAGRMVLRYGRHASSGPLRTSMRILGASCSFGLLYAAHRLVYVVANEVGWRGLNSSAVAATSQVLLACTLLLFVGGMSWPSLAEQALRHRARRDARAIRPLWELLRSATPEVVLVLPAELRRDPRLVVYRYVIEVRDCILALDGHLPPRRRAAAVELLSGAGLAGAELEAAVEAALLRFAVRAELTGAPPQIAEQTAVAGRADFGAEVDWFRQVAAMTRRSAVTSTVRTLCLAAGVTTDDDPSLPERVS
ncbi:MAB_1171c family putative transporter [Kitasatospora sp. LaBMicrA B282]|uniref:MAB_1171c family putative transporter n=1 Tax=Kitasatospora sp. LaBMicrA B282 TaxID=3420949 RepID=UPI003D09C737